MGRGYLFFFFFQQSPILASSVHILFFFLFFFKLESLKLPAWRIGCSGIGTATATWYQIYSSNQFSQALCHLSIHPWSCYAVVVHWEKSGNDIYIKVAELLWSLEGIFMLVFRSSSFSSLSCRFLCKQLIITFYNDEGLLGVLFSLLCMVHSAQYQYQ